jgi:hypothetical protein
MLARSYADGRPDRALAAAREASHSQPEHNQPIERRHTSEHEQRQEADGELEREETIVDLEVPSEQADQVSGGMVRAAKPLKY